MFYNQSEWWRASNDYCLKRGGKICHVAPQGERCHAAFSGDLAPVLLALGARGRTAIGARHALAAAGAAVSRRRRRPPDAGSATNCSRGCAFAAAAPGVVCGYRKARVRGAIDFPLAAVAVALALRQGVIVSLRDRHLRHQLASVAAGRHRRAAWASRSTTRCSRASASWSQQQVSPMRSTATPSNYRRQVAAATDAAAAARTRRRLKRARPSANFQEQYQHGPYPSP